MDQSRALSTPIQESFYPDKMLEVKNSNYCESNTPYHEAIGSLMYLIIENLPGIAFELEKLAKFCDNPEQKHWGAVQHLLRYISGSKSVGICYKRGNSVFPLGFSDADWEGDMANRKWTSRFCYCWEMKQPAGLKKAGNCGNTNVWGQIYRNVCGMQKKAVLLRRVISFLFLCKQNVKTLRIVADSQSSLNLSNTEGFHRWNKHIDIVYHYVRHFVAQKLIF